MATWNQGINAGDLLAGMGRLNDNAPKAEDVNASLGMIRDNNDRERAGQNNLGLQLLGAAGAITKDHQDAAFRQDYANAYASGDRNAMRQLATRYPNQFEAVRNGMGFIDDDQRNTVGSLASSARLASQSPQGMAQWLQANAGDLARVGVNPSDVAQLYQQNPAGFGQFVDHLGIASLGPDKYFDLQSKNAHLQQSGRIAQANLDLGQQRLSLTAQKNQADIANKQWELSLKAGENNSKAQTTQQNAVQKMQDYVGAYQNHVGQVSNMLDTLNRVKGIDPKVFDGVFGFGGGIKSMIPGTATADAWAQIEQMQGQARQMGVIGLKGTGAVSDSEGQAAARAFLNIKQNTSPKAARAAIDNWQKVLARQATYMEKQKPTIDTYQQKIDTFNAGKNGGSATAPRAGQIDSGYTFLGGDPSNPNSWRKN
ncbi:phage DNA ejection protein [Serratia symbiotica]|uniref:phage DNA ejection protein n=1 Tax=Serratia symbiotica TaxID=138074 RepID=UPI001CF09FB0|nr:phage DNA ejection protein [Serratia symbiotica]